MPTQALLPEFFMLLGIDLFLMLSLLTCLLDERFPRAIPYVYQAAAVMGFGQLLIGKDFLGLFGEGMRFWNCFFFLVIALANILALNVYIAAIKGSFKFAKVWSGAVTFPSILVSAFFLSQYSLMQGMPLLLILQISLLLSACMIAMGFSFLLSPEATRKLFRRNKDVSSDIKDDQTQEID